MLIMSAEEVNALTKKVDRILFYLDNDDHAGQKGLISQVKELRTDFNTFKIAYDTQQAVKKAKIGVIGVVGGAIGTGLIWIAEQIVKHMHF